MIAQTDVYGLSYGLNAKKEPRYKHGSFRNIILLPERRQRQPNN